MIGVKRSYIECRVIVSYSGAELSSPVVSVAKESIFETSILGCYCVSVQRKTDVLTMIAFNYVSTSVQFISVRSNLDITRTNTVRKHRGSNYEVL